LFVGDSGADDGEHFGVGGIDDNGRALQEVGFEAVAFFQRRQRATKGFLGFSIFLPIKSEKQFMFKLNCNVDTQLTDSY